MVQRYSVAGFSGRELIFNKLPSYSWKTYPPFSTTKDKGCFIAPCEWRKKKQRQFDLTPTIAGDFCQPPSLASIHNYDPNYYINISSATAYFLVRPFSCFRSTSKYSCICLLMQTRRKWRHIASFTKKTELLPIECRVLSRVLSHSHRATPDPNLWLLFLSWQILCPGNTAVGKIMK